MGKAKPPNNNVGKYNRKGFGQKNLNKVLFNKVKKLYIQPNRLLLCEVLLRFFEGFPDLTVADYEVEHCKGNGVKNSH